MLKNFVAISALVAGAHAQDTATAGMVARHVGAACGADNACPPGMFCNFDATPFCEACLDCGSPDDDWAGCTDCGLPEAGGADCTAQW
jgi:hypothetical protein